MECKDFKSARNYTSEVVLIETLWNVKIVNLFSCCNIQPVLIETLWNVKKGCSTLYVVLRVVLIETLWNVKFVHASNFDRKYKRY